MRNPSPIPCKSVVSARLWEDASGKRLKNLVESATRHAGAALGHVAGGEYAGEHWLATFAVYLLCTPAPG